MKKLGLLVMPFMAISLLASCGSTKYYTVSFDTAGGSFIAPQQVENGKTAIKPSQNPTKKEGDFSYHFDGWFKDNQEFVFDETPITEDVTIQAKWSGEPTKSYTLTLDAGQGTFAHGATEVSFELKGGTKLLPYLKAIQPSLKDYTFAYYEYKDKENPIDYDDVLNEDITVEAYYVLSSNLPLSDLNNLDWKTIKNISVTGSPSELFTIGATKDVTLFDVGNFNPQIFSHSVRIIDFNHDTTSNGDLIGITFEFINIVTPSDGGSPDKDGVIWDGKRPSRQNNFEYRNSFLNNILNDKDDPKSVISMLPHDLREVIKPADKKVGVNESKTEGQSNFEARAFSPNYPCPKLFPLAYEEMGATGQEGVVPNEGTIYKFYENPLKEDARRRKNFVGEPYPTERHYWLRSPYSKSTMVAFFSGSKEIKTSQTILNRAGVAPAFCI
ncbi:MAG: InlB B-repeat-containing protein [Bacilli bacterium]|nr:InlB B-repeat-containing protein [Bacilli bacterium]